MIYLKIIALIISIGAGLIRVGLDYKWHDKRTNKHKLIKNILVVLMILGLLFMPFVNKGETTHYFFNLIFSLEH